MSGLRLDVGCVGTGVLPPLAESHCRLSGGLACLSVCQPDLSTAGPRLDAGFFWFAFFPGADAGVFLGPARPQSPGTRNSQAHLLRIHSFALAVGGGAFPERQARFAEKSRLPPFVGGKPFLHERARAWQSAPIRRGLAR